MAVAGVAMHDALGDDAVDDALRFAQACRRDFLVARRNGLGDLLHRGAHLGAQRHVVVAPHDCLTGALADGFDVGHELVTFQKRGRILT